MNIDWNFDEKASILASFLLLLTSACLFLRIKNFINFMYGFGISNWGSENFENWTKRPKWTRILILFFVASGTGKIVRDDFWSKTNAFSYFISFPESQNEAPTCVVQKFPKKIISRYTNRTKPFQKSSHFWKFWKINHVVMETQSIFLGMNFGGAAWPGLAWLGWLAGLSASIFSFNC